MDYSVGTRTQFTYDLADRLVSQKEYAGTGQNGVPLRSSTDFTYADKTNYLTGVKHFSPIGTQNIAYNYGNVIIGQMPDQVYSVSWNGVEKVTNKFDSLSRLSKRTVNGLATNYTYKDLEGNQTTTFVESINTGGISYVYDYDEVNNIKSVTVGNKKTTYEYDELNQLTRVNDPFENVTHVYTYNNGNIVYDLVYEYSVGVLPSYPLSATQYLYENATWSDILTGIKKSHFDNGVEIIDDRYSISSDTIGNITNLNGPKYSWLGRQLQSVSNSDNSNTTYSYNADGQRIAKAVNSANGDEYNYRYYYNGNILAGYRLVITKSDGSSTTHNVAFMYDENGEAFGFNYNGNDYYYVRNAQNDVIFISNSDNTGVVMYQYDAWGNMTACYDTSDDGMLSIVNPYAYRGYFYEIETNTYFLKSRYYNPELCRFISADGYVQTGQGLLDKNMFAYCGNNPVNRVDETGYGWRDIWNGIKSFLSSIFGWSSSIETTSNENCVPFLPEPLPVTLEMTEKQTVTKPKSGDSSKPITAFLKTNTKHPIKSSTVGIKVNIAKLSFTTDLGLDNFGSSVSCTIGDTTYGFRKRGDITRLKIGYEFSAETQIGEDVKDGVYTNVSLSGWFLLMAYAYATTGSPAPSSQYSYAN